MRNLGFETITGSLVIQRRSYLAAGMENKRPFIEVSSQNLDYGRFKRNAGLPVSYTHLDVYKRQPYPLMLSGLTLHYIHEKREECGLLTENHKKRITGTACENTKQKGGLFMRFVNRKVALVGTGLVGMSYACLLYTSRCV